MGITSYKIEESPGVVKKFYLVIAEGINKYTGRRVQKKRRGITSEAKAERIYRELWSQCKEERPNGPLISRWGELGSKYFIHLDKKVRTLDNPNGFSPKTIVTKKSHFGHLKHWEDLHLELINAEFVRDELDKLEADGKAGRSLTAEIQKTVSAAMTYAVECGILSAHPLTTLKKRKVPKKKKQAFTHEEANKLLYEAKERNHPYFLVWLLSITLGLRRSELAGLKWTDIDFENGLASICRQVQPKEGLVPTLKDKEDRVVAVPNYVLPVLKECRLKSKSDFVIDLDCKQWLGGHQASVLRAFCQEIGLKEITHRQLRSTHITLLINDGIPLAVVKDNVGHSKLSTTDEYYASAGIYMRGKTDGLRIKVPTGLKAEITPLKRA